MSPTKTGRKIRSDSGKGIQSDEKAIRLGAGGIASAIAAALHAEFGGTRVAIKTVVKLTTANERAVKNWFDGVNGPNGEFLLALCRHSDRVFETVLKLSGRSELLRIKKFTDIKKKLHELLSAIEDIEAH